MRGDDRLCRDPERDPTRLNKKPPVPPPGEIAAIQADYARLTHVRPAQYDARFQGETTGDLAGYAVSVEDVNNDGYDDILIGAPNYPNEKRNGAAYIIYGQPNSSLLSGSYYLGSQYGARFVGGNASDYLGAYIAGVGGDADGDGVSGDILIGAPSYPSGSARGAVYLIGGGLLSGDYSLGSSYDARFVGEYDGYDVGPSSGPGDLSGDGHVDILVGAPRYDSKAYYGAAYLINGGSLSGDYTLGPDYAARFVGEPNDFAGDRKGITRVGDVNGDGKNDILIGAIYNNNETGKAYLVYGW